MNAIQVVRPRETRLAEVPAPRIQAGEALVRPAFVGVCGTDLEMLEGTMPYFALDLAHYPVILGHEFSGVVVDGGTTDVVAGTPVVADPVIGCGRCDACGEGPPTRCQSRYELGLRLGRDGGLAEGVAVPRANLHRIPTGVSLRDAVVVEPSVTSIASVDRLGTSGAERVLIIGDGTIGLVAAQVLLAAGSRVSVLQRSPARRTLVETIGATPVSEADLRSGAAAGFTGSIEASGTNTGVASAIASVRPGGIVALAGVYTEPTSIDWTDVVLRELTISGILNGPGRYDRALDLIRQGVIRPDLLIDRTFDVEDAQQAFQRAAEHGRPRPKVVISMETWSHTGQADA